MQCTYPFWLKSAQMMVPCGKCTQCRIARAREWATRMIHELAYHDKACFVTLTFDDQHIPPGESVSKSDFQRFMKRLRKDLPDRKMKYYACGEYGEQSMRPHYHAIIYGLGIEDHLQDHGRILAGPIKKCWPFGYSYIGTVTYDSARYVADYIHKKYSGVKHEEVYGRRSPPFQLSSNGIGREYIYANAVQLSDDLGCTIRGKQVGLPRYYRKKLNIDPEVLAAISQEREAEINKAVWKKIDGSGTLRERSDQWYAIRDASRKQAEKNAVARQTLSKLRKGRNV